MEYNKQMKYENIKAFIAMNVKIQSQLWHTIAGQMT